MKREYKVFRYLLVFLCLFLITFLASSTSAADFPEGREDQFIENNITFYEPGIESRNFATYYSSYGCNAGSGNQNYKGDTIWTDAELQVVEKNRPFYEKSANDHNLPWQLIAAIHYQEHSLLRTNPANGQGIYQLYSYTNGGKNENRFEPTYDTPVSDDEFQRQTDITAGIIKSKASGLNLSTSDGIKRTLYNYNGASSLYHDKALDLGFSEAEAANGEGSPYVMNRYDEQRDPTNPNVNPAWAGVYTGDGQYASDTSSQRFGTFVRYMALVGITNSTTYTTSSSNTTTANFGASTSPLTKVALQIAKQGYNSGDTTPSNAYVAAMKAVGNYQKPNGVKPEGASCDQFVSTVVRYSGVDPDFPTFGPLDQKAHMEKHTELYEQINPGGNINNLRDGDILVTGDSNFRHIQIFITINGRPGLAAASYGNRTGQYWATTNSILSIGRDNGTYYYSVFRYKGNAVGLNSSNINNYTSTTTSLCPTLSSTTTTTASAAPTTTAYPSANGQVTSPKAFYNESDFEKNSESIACPSGTLTIGAYNNAHYLGNQVAINLCEVPNINYGGSTYTRMESNNGHAVASSLAAEAFNNFAADFKQLTGKTISATQTFRTYEFQSLMYECAKSGATQEGKKAFEDAYGKSCSGFTGPGRPGSSKHESGLAIDLDLKSLFNTEGEDNYGYNPSSCTTGAFVSGEKTDSGTKWNGKSRWTLKGMATLCEMLPKYGLKLTVTTEPWHLQYVGK